MEEKKGILIRVSLKHLGNVTKRVKAYPFPLEETPRTLRELIALSARSCLRAFLARAEEAKDPRPLTEEQYVGMREIGKFAFGFTDPGNVPGEPEAIGTAMQAYEDGLVRVFLNGEELTGPDDVLTVVEGDEFTFVRLTMLSGRMW